MTSPLSDFSRYAVLIEQTIPDLLPFSPETENAAALQVERGTVYPMLLKNRPLDDRIERLIELTRFDRFRHIAVVDRTGHHRPVYRALLIYAWLQSFHLAYESLPRPEFGRWEEALRLWCDALEAELNSANIDHTLFTAACGATATEACWTALALHVAGKLLVRDAWTDLASDLFGQLARAQQSNGAFLLTTPSDNPETHWYHELVILHAAASFAVQTEDRTLAAVVQRNTEFHLSETQPDHATTQPFALFPFLWNANTRLLADQVLHATQIQHPAGPQGLSAILLADTLYNLRLFPPSRAAHESV